MNKQTYILNADIIWAEKNEHKVLKLDTKVV